MAQIKEIGFWDYSCPQNGSLDQYDYDDWQLLLDDMAEGGINSLVLCPKWLTTGYKSKLPWLDQGDCTAIKTDNKVLRFALEEARKRGIICTLLVVSTQFNVASFGSVPDNPKAIWGETGSYDLDFPGLHDRVLDMYTEIHDLFGDLTDRYVCELEFCDNSAPHRIPKYDAWAKENNEPSFADISNITLQPRDYPFLSWRKFTTWCRANMLNDIYSLLKNKGFTGGFSTIAEVGNAEQVMVGNTDFAVMKKNLPTLELVTYDSIYDRKKNRESSIEFCVTNPKKYDYTVHWLTRGVMTFGENWDDVTDNLDEQWDLSIADAAKYQPDSLWFMGADAREENGLVCNSKKLPAWGYDDGITARRSLIKKLKDNLGLKSL